MRESLATLLAQREAATLAITTRLAPVVDILSSHHGGATALLSEVYLDSEFKRVIVHIELPPMPEKGIFRSSYVNVSLPLNGLDDILQEPQESLRIIVLSNLLEDVI